MPYIVGIFIEYQQKSVIDEFNQTNRYGKIETANYERGYKSSRSTIRWIPPQELIQKISLEHEVFNIENTIQHSVLGVSVNSRFVPTKKQLEWLNGEPRQDNPLILNAQLNPLGTANIEIQTHSISVRQIGYNNIEITAQPAKLDLEFNVIDDVIFGTLDWGGLTLNSSDRSVNIGSIGVTINGHRTADYRWLGDGDMTVESLTATSESTEQLIQLNELKFKHHVTASKRGTETEKINMHIVYQLKLVKYNSYPYSDIQLRGSINNVDPSALQDFLIQTNVFLHKGVSVLDQPADLLTRYQMMAPLLALTKLLSKEFAINIEKLYFSTPSGNVTGSASLLVNRTFTPAYLIRLLVSPLEVTQRIALYAIVEAPLDITSVENAHSNFINSGLEKGFVVRNGNKLTASAKISTTGVTINEQDFKLK